MSSLFDSDKPVNAWHCDHAQTEKRGRTIKGGAVRAELQCLRCGRSVRAVKHDGPTFALPAWDAGLEDGFNERTKAEMNRRLEEKARARREEGDKWFKWYTEYLGTAEWRERSRRTIARAGGICEARLLCDGARATQAHHVTYEHAGNEPLFDLRAVCEPCHERITALDRARRERVA